jgi:hypothetical protein
LSHNNNDLNDNSSEDQTPILKKRDKRRSNLVRRVLAEYSNTSTIHGVRYITEFRKSKFDK